MVFAALLVSFAVTASALDCSKAITTPDVNDCARIEQDKVEVQLDEVYRRVLKGLELPDTEVEKRSEMKASLIAAQREWIKFREADCQAVYIRHASGTIRGLMYISCMQDRAETRIRELQMYEQE